MAIVHATSSTSNYCTSYTISEDLQTVTEGGWIWSSGSSRVSKLELYVSSYGNVYCVRYTYETANGGAYAYAFKDTGTFNWSRIYYVDAASYDESTGHFCWTDDRNIYSAEELGGNRVCGRVPAIYGPPRRRKHSIYLQRFRPGRSNIQDCRYFQRRTIACCFGSESANCRSDIHM